LIYEHPTLPWHWQRLAGPGTIEIFLAGVQVCVSLPNDAVPLLQQSGPTSVPIKPPGCLYCMWPSAAHAKQCSLLEHTGAGWGQERLSAAFERAGRRPAARPDLSTATMTALARSPGERPDWLA
jgi:hypothetical protein